MFAVYKGLRVVGAGGPWAQQTLFSRGQTDSYCPSCLHVLGRSRCETPFLCRRALRHVEIDGPDNPTS